MQSLKSMNNLNKATNTNFMIVLGVHMSGCIGCDVKIIHIPRAITEQYFKSEQARKAIQNCIEQAKSNPLQMYRPNEKIRVQVTHTIAQAIKTGEIESILGLKEFLEEIRKETNAVTAIGSSAKKDEILEI